MSSLRRRAALATAVALFFGVVGSAAAEPPPSTEFTKRIIVQPGFGFTNDETDDGCTAGFLLRDRVGAVYVVTDGNCAPNGRFRDGAGTYKRYIGSRTWPVGKGPAVNRVQRVKSRVGRYVAQVITENSRELNYALIRIDKGLGYSGEVAVLTGPTQGAYTGETTSPMRLTYVCRDGYSTASWAGDDTDTRSGYQDGVSEDLAPDGLRRTWFSVATPADGRCAGAPVVLGGDGVQAVGINGGYLGGGTPKIVEGRVASSANVVYRLDAIIADAQQRFAMKLQFVMGRDRGTTKR